MKSRINDRLRRVLFGVFAILLACAVRADIPPLPEFPSLVFEPPEPGRVTLSNGMRLYLLEDHELPVFDILAMIRTGSVYDPPDKIGLAGLTATVLRTGGTTTRSPDEINETLEFIAGAVESGMQAEHASAGLSVMSKDTALGIELFADILMHPAFRDEKIELARNQALEGIRRQNDEPNGIAARKLGKLIYGSHPYGNKATVKTLGNITRDDLIAFHARYYRPDAMTMAITGDFQRDEIIAQIEKAFAGWNPPKQDAPSLSQVEETRAFGVFHVEKELNQTAIRMGHLGITYASPDKVPLNVLNFILGGDFTSRLNQEVRIKRGLAYGAGSGFSRMRDRGVFIVGSSTKSSSTVQTIAVIQDVLKAIREAPPAEEEIALAKNSIINSFIFAYTSNAQIAEQAMWFDYYGYPSDWLKTYRDKVVAVTPEELLRVAREYIHPETLTVVTVGQESRFDKPLSELGNVTRLPLDDGGD